MTPYLHAMTRGEIFRIAWEMVRKTIGRIAIICGILVFLPCMGLVLVAYESALTVLSKVALTAGMRGDVLPDGIVDIFFKSINLPYGTTGYKVGAFITILLLFVGTFAFGIVSLWAYVAITRIVAAEMIGKTVPWRTAIRQAWTQMTPNIILHKVVEWLVYVIILAMIYNSAKRVFEGDLLYIIFLLVGGFIFVFSISTHCLGAFVPTVMMCEGLGVKDSYKRSDKLVRNRFSRVFGIVMPFESVLFFFVICILWPSGVFEFILPYMNNIILHIHEEITIADLNAMFENIMALFLIILAAALPFIYIVNPAIHVVTYFDCVPRNGEIPQPTETRLNDNVSTSGGNDPVTV